MMVKTLLVAMMVTALLTSQGRAADPELSLETKKMLAYGSLAVMVGACKAPITPAQESSLNSGLQKAAEAQREMTEAQFTETMKVVGAQVGQNREQICAALTPDFIDSSLEEAAAGQ